VGSGAARLQGHTADDWRDWGGKEEPRASRAAPREAGPDCESRRYAEALRKAFVVVDVAERRLSIRKALDAATRTIPRALARDEQLIETVVHLTEWPTVCWAL